MGVGVRRIIVAYVTMGETVSEDVESLKVGICAMKNGEWGMENGAKGYADKSMVLTLTLMRMWNRDEEDEAEGRVRDIYEYIR